MKSDYFKEKYGTSNPLFMTKLFHNYRNHPAILSIPNKLFYDNELVACGKSNIIHAFDRKPIIFHDINGVEAKLKGSAR